MTKAWTRWEDWGAVVLGVLTALAPIVVTTSAAAVTTMIVLGVLTVAAGLWSLAQPGMVATEWITMALGVLLFVSPFVMTYTALPGAAWTSWIIGVLEVAISAVAVPAANAVHRGLTAQH